VPDASASASPPASPGSTPFVIAQSGDPAALLTIDPGYTFVKLGAKDAASLMSLVSSSLQSSKWKVDVGVRAVDRGGTLVGYLMVGQFPAGVLADAFYQQALAKMASTMGVTISSTTIDGHVVATGHLGAVSIVAYHAGDAMIGTIAQTAARAKAVITALIAANP
jgi:hypothetical protein